MQRLIAAAALLLVLAACNRDEREAAETNPAPDTAAATATSPATDIASTPPPATGLAPADRTFAETAAKMGMAEIQLATNVSNRAQTQEVRSFAQRMIIDHNRANEELITLGVQKGFGPPADIDADKKQLDAKLATLTGPQLDLAYMQAMVDDHAKAVAAFESAAAQVTDADLKAWAAKTLPVLHEHHREAQEILGTLE